MIVENITKVDGPIIVHDLEKAHVRRQTGSFVLQGLVLACGIAMMVMGIISKSSANIAIGTVFILLSFIYLAYSLNRIKNEKEQIKVVNKTVFENGCTYNYKFKQESIFVDFRAGEKHQKFECKYDEVRKIYEHPTKYEIVLYDHTILYADKAGFENDRMMGFFLKNLEINKKKVKVLKD